MDNRVENDTVQETLYKVAWCNLWNIARANNADGVGSLVHLTTTSDWAGTTLCGKAFPRVKGYPSPVRYCKRCLKKAPTRSLPLHLTGLPWIPSAEE